MMCVGQKEIPADVPTRPQNSIPLLISDLHRRYAKTTKVRLFAHSRQVGCLPSLPPATGLGSVTRPALKDLRGAECNYQNPQNQEHPVLVTNQFHNSISKNDKPRDQTKPLCGTVHAQRPPQQIAAFTMRFFTLKIDIHEILLQSQTNRFACRKANKRVVPVV